MAVVTAPSAGEGGADTARILVSDEHIGRVIGARGAGLQKLRLESGAGINVPRDRGASGERYVEVTGTPAQIMLVQTLIDQVCAHASALQCDAS